MSGAVSPFPLYACAVCCCVQLWRGLDQQGLQGEARCLSHSWCVRLSVVTAPQCAAARRTVLPFRNWLEV
jgi:hypothetical protein